MENEYNSKKREKVDILSLHTELGSVETDYQPEPKGLEYEALFSDPALEGISSYQLRGLHGAGMFFDVGYQGRYFTLHQSVISRLYRIENFVVKRNYYCSDKTPVVTHAPEILGSIHPGRQSPIIKSQKGDAQYNEQLSQSARSTPQSFLGSSAKQWADVEEEVCLMDFNQDQTRPSTDTRKPVPPPRFLSDTFLDELPTMRQHLVPYQDYLEIDPGIEHRDFYLFDFVALFTDFKSLFERQIDFKFSVITQKLELLNEISQGRMAFMPMQADKEGWNPMIRFLCQTLNGEIQISFLRVALFFSVRKVAQKWRLQKEQKIDLKTKSFLLGDESIRIDSSRTVRLNLSALANNQKVQIDRTYAQNCVTPVPL